jgi:hypothetical protein
MSAGVFEQKKKSVKFNGQGERERKEEKVLYGEQGTHTGSAERVLQEEKKGGLRIYSGTREDNQVRLALPFVKEPCYCSTCMNLLSEINKVALGGIIQKDLLTSDKNTTQKSE